VVQVPALAPLPAADASADIVLCFTVLQHLTDAELAAVVPELLRVRRPGGAVVLVEETDASLEAGKAERADLGYTRGRPVEAYAALLAPLTVVHTQPRRIEPTYPRPDVGTYMVFR
jgi:SAM-dependent methyltransferase